ncbi:MAG: hypothetical protein COB66_09600 [Coxiella sp. (in: Bacteria)]|nr:MAG: hypothetical protein COB66_09600 [Coxiella sp. (in: g-proteobacteria)]
MERSFKHMESSTPQLTLREELLNHLRKAALKKGQLVKLALERYGDELRSASGDKVWGIEGLLNDPVAKADADKLEKQVIGVIASRLGRKFDALFAELRVALAAPHIYHRKGKFDEIAELYLSLQSADTNPELIAILRGDIGRDFGLQFLLTQATSPGTFQSPTTPSRLAFEHQDVVWDHDFRVEGKHSYRHPLEVLSGNYFMTQCRPLFRLTFKLQSARNYFYKGHTDQALSSLQTARECWRALPEVIRSSIDVSPVMFSILSQKTSIDEANFGLYFDDIAATVKKCRPHIFEHLQKSLALNDLEAIYAKIIMNQSEIIYLDHITDKRNLDQAELFNVIPRIHSLITDQLELANKAVEHHPGAGHFMQGYILCYLARFLFLLDRLPIDRFNCDTFFRAHPEIRDTFTGNSLENRGQGTVPACAQVYMERACKDLKFADVNRSACHRAETNCFSPSPEGFDGCALFEPDEPSTSLKQLLKYYQGQRAKLTALVERDHQQFHGRR